jgi:glycosyltransferase involved in cell wall biosynthesis
MSLLRKSLLSSVIQNLQDNVRIFLEISLSKEKPIHSVVVPVHNASTSISSCLSFILKSCSMNFELIIFLDSCTDNSHCCVKNFAQSVPLNTNLVKITVLETCNSAYETFCDAYSIKQAESEYIFEIQSDMFIQDRGFDARVISIMKQNPDIVCLSGRGAMSISNVRPSQINCCLVGTSWPIAVLSILSTHTKIAAKSIKRLFKYFSFKPEVIPNSDRTIINTSHYNPGKIQDYRQSFLEHGNIFFSPVRSSDTFALPGSSAPVFLSDYVVRGPLCIHREKYLGLGGLNIYAYFLGYDDVDFCCRANTAGLRSGFTPISYWSPEDLGSSRRRRSIVEKLLLLYNIWIRSYFPSVSRIINKSTEYSREVRT